MVEPIDYTKPIEVPILDDKGKEIGRELVAPPIDPTLAVNAALLSVDPALAVNAALP